MPLKKQKRQRVKKHPAYKSIIKVPFENGHPIEFACILDNLMLTPIQVSPYKIFGSPKFKV